MGNVSLFGYQSDSSSARNAFDLCILDELKKEQDATPEDEIEEEDKGLAFFRRF